MNNITNMATDHLTSAQQKAAALHGSAAEQANLVAAHASNTVGAAANVFKVGWAQYPGADPKTARSAQMKCGCAGGQNEDPEKCDFIYRLRSDLANLYWWSGNPVFDYIYFVCQWHPVLGILLSHPNHPWSKAERFGMFVISVAYSVIPSAVIAESEIGCMDKLKDYPVETSAEALVKTSAEALCLGAVKSGAVLFITLPNIVLGVILYQLAIADTRCPACNRGCGGALTGLKKCCFSCTLFIAMGLSIGAYFILKSFNAPIVDLARPLVYGLVLSWATWFPLFLLLPFIGFVHEWWMEKKAWEAGEEPGKASEA